MSLWRRFQEWRMRRIRRRAAARWANRRAYEQGWRLPAGWRVYFERLTFCFVIETDVGMKLAELIPHDNQGYQIHALPSSGITQITSVIAPTVQDGIDYMAILMGVEHGDVE